MDAKTLRPLLDALDDGYRHRPHEMLGFFLTGIMSLWGMPAWQPVPTEVQPRIRDAIDAYATLVARLPPFMDVLGPLYMELASRGGKKALGQFFTPYPVAAMMATMTIGTQPPEVDRLTRICDPACGSGVMMLGFAHEALCTWGSDALLRLSITGCDIDHYCARMMAVQLISNCNVHGLRFGEIVILRGNSLAPWTDMQTILHATAPSVAHSESAQAPARLAALAAAAGAHPDTARAAPGPASEGPLAVSVMDRPSPPRRALRQADLFENS